VVVAVTVGRGGVERRMVAMVRIAFAMVQVVMKSESERVGGDPTPKY
jgi:hypothetical protein